MFYGLIETAKARKQDPMLSQNHLLFQWIPYRLSKRAPQKPRRSGPNHLHGRLRPTVMNIKLNLEKHCIQTELKRVQSRLISRCLKSEDPDLDAALTCVQTALDRWDFPELRHAHASLRSGGRAAVFLITSDTGHPILQIDGHGFDPDVHPPESGRSREVGP